MQGVSQHTVVSTWVAGHIDPRLSLQYLGHLLKEVGGVVVLLAVLGLPFPHKVLELTEGVLLLSALHLI